jgi:hypothetical protein
LRFRLEEGHAHQPWFNAVQALAEFKKEEVDAILARMERLKTLIEIPSQIDHL